MVHGCHTGESNPRFTPQMGLLTPAVAEEWEREREWEAGVGGGRRVYSPTLRGSLVYLGCFLDNVDGGCGPG